MSDLKIQSSTPRSTERASASVEPVCRFYRLIPDAPEPRRADASADGMLSTRAYRYCEALRSASAFGWYVYPPLNFSLVFDGTELAWTYDGADGWYALRGAQFPGFAEKFAAMAPKGARSPLPLFLTPAREPGVVQIWSGYLARTAPGWALLSRAPANIPVAQSYAQFDGLVEAASWFGPLFTNIRLTRTDSPVEFHVRYPLLQVQPILRQCYSAPSFDIVGPDDWSPADWERFAATMRPNQDPMRRLGHYAAATRKGEAHEATVAAPEHGHCLPVVPQLNPT